jgi:hypothetical protein
MTKNEHAAHEHARSNRPTEEQIAQRAYELFLARGATDGQDVEDWLGAERALRTTRGSDHPR